MLPRACVLPVACFAAMAPGIFAETPKLHIRTAHGGPGEEQRKEQVERLAKKYDLAKYTITRDIEIDRGAINHSMPTLTLNLRFLDNDDLALSAYVHEQAHWLLVERYRYENPALFDELQRTFPGLDYRQPEGDGQLRSSYFHIAVCMLEWQAMEELTDASRARSVIEWKQRDHYKAVYAILLQHRDSVEAVLHRHGVKW